MKKFIEALKEAGIYDHIVENNCGCQKQIWCKGCNQRNHNDSETEMIRNPKLLDVFMDDIEDLGFKTVGAEIMKSVVDVEKIDAMKDVNPDELFKKATEQGDSGLKKSNEEALEDAVVGGFIDFLNGIANMLND